MLICPGCGEKIESSSRKCRSCAFSTALRNGFVAWAPHLEESYQGFNTESFSSLAAAEDRNFWFVARNKLIIWALGKYFNKFNSLLEVGCGTGYVLSGISREYPSAKLVGSEIFSHGLQYASARLENTELIQADARALPYREEFDVVVAFDVVEHIKEDELAFANIYRSIKFGGGCLITVPQHQWLWSGVDEEACHERRYEVLDLHTKVEAAGFKIVNSTSFVSLLLPLMWFSRCNNRHGRTSNSNSELQPSSVVNWILGKIMDFERFFIRLGVRFPIGGSRLLVAVKE